LKFIVYYACIASKLIRSGIDSAYKEEIEEISVEQGEISYDQSERLVQKALKRKRI